MISNFHGYGWATHKRDVNAHMHGSPGARRRLFTACFSERVVAAAQRAGIEFQRCGAVSHSQRRVLADALVRNDTIDAFHPDLYTGHRLTVPRLYGDRRDTRQVARINTGKRESEPVGDARLAAMPMKCFGEAPLIMLPDGRVRRTLLSEFAAVGSVPWSVDRLMGANPTADEVQRAKTMMGNTWDGVLTRALVDATLAYIAPFIEERAMLAAEPARLAARFMTVVMRVLLPVRRAWRRLQHDVADATSGDDDDEEVTLFWQRLGKSAVMLHTRQAIGFMGDVGCANALWKLLVQGATQDGRLTQENGREATATSEGVDTAAGISKSGSVHLTPALDAEMFGSGMGRHECVAVTVSMMPDCRNTPTQKLWGTRLALPSEVRCSALHERPLPLTTAASRHVKAARAVVAVGGTAGSLRRTVQIGRISVHGRRDQPEKRVRARDGQRRGGSGTTRKGRTGRVACANETGRATRRSEIDAAAPAAGGAGRARSLSIRKRALLGSIRRCRCQHV